MKIFGLIITKEKKYKESLAIERLRNGTDPVPWSEYRDLEKKFRLLCNHLGIYFKPGEEYTVEKSPFVGQPTSAGADSAERQSLR